MSYRVIKVTSINVYLTSCSSGNICFCKTKTLKKLANNSSKYPLQQFSKKFPGWRRQINFVEKYLGLGKGARRCTAKASGSHSSNAPRSARTRAWEGADICNCRSALKHLCCSQSTHGATQMAAQRNISYRQADASRGCAAESMRGQALAVLRQVQALAVWRYGVSPRLQFCIISLYDNIIQTEFFSFSKGKPDAGRWKFRDSRRRSARPKWTNQVLSHGSEDGSIA